MGNPHARDSTAVHFYHGETVPEHVESVTMLATRPSFGWRGNRGTL